MTDYDVYVQRGVGQAERYVPASELDAARAEVERLHKLFNDAGKGEHNVLALVDHLHDRCSAAEDEVQRLRDLQRRAVEVIADRRLECSCVFQSPCGTCVVSAQLLSEVQP